MNVVREEERSVIWRKEKDEDRSEPTGGDISLHCSYWFHLSRESFSAQLILLPWGRKKHILLRHCYESCLYITSSLTRGWVCRLQLLLVLFSAVILRDSWPHFTVSDSRFRQPGGPGPRIYITQEQGGPVISPGTVFPFHRVLRLAGLPWKYWTPPPHGNFSYLQSSKDYVVYRPSDTLSDSLVLRHESKLSQLCCKHSYEIDEWYQT
jgi:hypothetical protein